MTIFLLSRAGCQNNSKVASSIYFEVTDSHILLTFGLLFSSESDSMNKSKSGAESYNVTCLDRRDYEQIRVFSRRSWEKHVLAAREHPHKTMDEPSPPHPTRWLLNDHITIILILILITVN